MKKEKKVIFLNVKGSIKYNHLVIATHSDQVKSVLDLDNIETKKFFLIWIIKEILFIFIKDSSLMPKNTKVWSCWELFTGL